MNTVLVTANGVVAAILQRDYDGAGQLLHGLPDDEARTAAFGAAIALGDILADHLPPHAIDAAIRGAQTFAGELAGDQ